MKTNSKEIRVKMIEFLTEDTDFQEYGISKGNNKELIKLKMQEADGWQALDEKLTPYKAGTINAQNGNYWAYNDQLQDFLINELNMTPEETKDSEKNWNLFKHLIGQAYDDLFYNKL